MPTFPTQVDTAALARRLQSPDDAERQQAQAKLQALIAGDVGRIKRIQYSVMATFALYIVMSIVVLVLGITSHWANCIFLIYPIILANFAVIYLLSRWKNRVARNIVAFDIPQAIGPLIEVYASTGFAQSPEIKMALTRLLPRLQPADACMLSQNHLNMLYRILYNHNYWLSDSLTADTTLSMAILRALEQIGDEKAIPRLVKLARLARNPQVRTAAQECLPFLKQRAEQTRIEQTLLRAGTQPTSDTLLRPSVSTTPTEPQQLLRASNMERNGNEP